MKLFYYPNNASLAPHFMLNELKVEFDLCLVDRKSEAQKSAEYLALNPAGRIPTFIHNELTIFESPAICVYLAEAFPLAKLIPPVGTVERAKFHQWMMYLTNTLQAELMIYFYPEKHTKDANSVDSIVQAQQDRLRGILALLNEELTGKEYLIADSVTACDFFLFMLAIWADEIQHPPLSFKHLARYLKQLAKRSSIRKTCEIEGISLDEYSI